MSLLTAEQYTTLSETIGKRGSYPEKDQIIYGELEKIPFTGSTLGSVMTDELSVYNMYIKLHLRDGMLFFDPIPNALYGIYRPFDIFNESGLGIESRNGILSVGSFRSPWKRDASLIFEEEVTKMEDEVSKRILGDAVIRKNGNINFCKFNGKTITKKLVTVEAALEYMRHENREGENYVVREWDGWNLIRERKMPKFKTYNVVILK